MSPGWESQSFGDHNLSSPMLITITRGMVRADWPSVGRVHHMNWGPNPRFSQQPGPTGAGNKDMLLRTLCKDYNYSMLLMLLLSSGQLGECGPLNLLLAHPANAGRGRVWCK